MRIHENPFNILEVTPYDSIEDIMEKAEEKAFFDEVNQKKYDDACHMLTSMNSRLQAEVRWIYTNEKFDFNDFFNEMYDVDDVIDAIANLDLDAPEMYDIDDVDLDDPEMYDIDDVDLDDPEMYDIDDIDDVDLDDPDSYGPYDNFKWAVSYSADYDFRTNARIIMYIEALYGVSVDDVAAALSDVDYDYANLDDIEDITNDINESRNIAGIHSKVEVNTVLLAVKEIKNDVADAIRYVMKSYCDDDIFQIANEFVEIYEYEEKEFGEVAKIFMDQYSSKYQDKLNKYRDSILSLIDNKDSFQNIKNLDKLKAKTRRFDYMAQPLQVYLLSIGRSDLQKQSVEVANKIRDLAIILFKERNSAEMANVLLDLDIELFSELPDICELVKQDKIFIDKLAKLNQISAELNNKFNEMDDNIVRKEGYEDSNRQYFESSLSEYDSVLTKFQNNLIEFSDTDLYEDGCIVIARKYNILSSALTWSNMWSEALVYSKQALEWAEKSNDQEFITDVQQKYNDIKRSYYNVIAEKRAEIQYNNSITYEGEWGIVFKDKIKISPKGIEWKNKIYPLNTIRYVSWGIYRQYINGINTSTKRYFNFKNGDVNISIDLGENVYDKFIECLWQAVSKQIITNILTNFKFGKPNEFSEKMSDTGYQYDEHNWFSKDVHKFYPWPQIGLMHENGWLVLVSSDKKRLVSFSYIDHYNIHMLEAILTLAKKRKVQKLSDLLN